MIAGKLRHRVELRKPLETVDAMGQGVISYSTEKTVYAQVEPLNGRELVDAQAANSVIDVKVIIRYYSGLTAKWQLKHGTHVYQIIALLNLSAGKKDLKLLCKELPAEAV